MYYGAGAGAGISERFLLTSTAYSPYQGSSVDDVASDESYFSQAGYFVGVGSSYNDSGTAVSSIAGVGLWFSHGLSWARRKLAS